MAFVSVLISSLKSGLGRNWKGLLPLNRRSAFMAMMNKLLGGGQTSTGGQFPANGADCNIASHAPAVFVEMRSSTLSRSLRPIGHTLLFEALSTASPIEAAPLTERKPKVGYLF
jgi:hypothetical protein